MLGPEISQSSAGKSQASAILGGLFQRFRGRDSGSRELEVGGIGDSQFAAQHGWALGSTSADHALAPTMQRALFQRFRGRDRGAAHRDLRRRPLEPVSRADGPALCDGGLSRNSSGRGRPGKRPARRRLAWRAGARGRAPCSFPRRRTSPRE